MAANKVNPLNFRLGVSRMFRFVNNIYLTNYSFLWFLYLEYERMLFNIFYKHKFWVVSSKIIHSGLTSIHIFCNYYRLRPYFNNKMYRRKRRKLIKEDPDGSSFFINIWKKNLKNVIWNHKVISCFKNKFLKSNYNQLSQLRLKRDKLIKLVYFFLKKNIDSEEKSVKKFKKPKLKFKILEKRESRHELKLLKYRLDEIDEDEFLDTLYYLKSNFILQHKLHFLHFWKHNILKNAKFKNFSVKKSLFFKYQDIQNFKLYWSKWLSMWSQHTDHIIQKFTIGCLFLSLPLKFLGVYDSAATQYLQRYIREKFFFFNFINFSKLAFNKKSVILKIRNLQFFPEVRFFKWDDALRTSYLIEIKKKHFIRNVFRDFVFLHRISLLQIDIFLFIKLIVNLFEITKFHKRLINLVSSVITSVSKFYLHIRCKLQFKGKMQYKRRTHTIILFKQSMPLGQVCFNIEYAKNFAITPFGILGIKCWFLIWDVKKIIEDEISFQKFFTYGKI